LNRIRPFRVRREYGCSRIVPIPIRGELHLI